MTVKLLDFANLTKVSDAQRLMKESLNKAAGHGDVKFVAARNYKIGGKLTALFLVIDPSAETRFLQLLKKQGTTVATSSGLATVTKSTTDAKHTILVKSAKGALSANIISTIVKPAVGNDTNFEATTPERQAAEKSQFKVESGQRPPLTVSHPEALVNEIERRKKKNSGSLSPLLSGEGMDLRESGVAEWAHDEYTAQSKHTVMASMTPDGKIGSIYFGEDGRIRTTHSVSPSQELHEGATILQFNIDETLALPAFEHAEPEQFASSEQWDHFIRWIKDTLKDLAPQNLPPWATLLDNPTQAHDLSTGAPPEDLKLFEIFKNINGEVENWHPSRGAGVKFETDKQTIAVLNAAIQDIDARFPKPPDHDVLDPQIAQLRKEILQVVRHQRNHPSEEDLEVIRNDKSIAKRIQVLGLDNPSLEELDNDKQISKRINLIFQQHLAERYETDDDIVARVAELEHIRGQRNVAFYEFVKSRLPKSQIVKAMRKPEEV